QNIVVSIPGRPDDETLRRIESSAKLEFRPVIYTDAAATSTVDASGNPIDPSTASPSPSVDPSLATTPTAAPTDASDPNWVSPALYAEYQAFDCSTLDKAQTNVAPADEPL